MRMRIPILAVCGTMAGAGLAIGDASARSAIVVVTCDVMGERSMAMRGILVHVDEHQSLPSVLTCALLVARRFDSQIDGLHARPGAPRIIPVAPEGAFIPASEIVEDLERADRDLDRQLRERYDAFMREHGVAAAGSVLPGAEAAAAWREDAGSGYETLGSLGRAYDLIAVARPMPGAAVPSMSALEAALFESGRPILIAPPAPPARLGDVVVIAWNGSTETARTIAVAMPFLEQAESVVVLSVEPGMVPGPPGAEIARGLAVNGIAARAQQINAGERTVGAAILDECRTLGADLLLKGAYTHSRLRQMIFGGATSHILGAAELPVIMAH
jgi:nucleotide-binding universal stress UspA family protein